MDTCNLSSGMPQINEKLGTLNVINFKKYKMIDSLRSTKNYYNTLTSYQTAAEKRNWNHHELDKYILSVVMK